MDFSAVAGSEKWQKIELISKGWSAEQVLIFSRRILSDYQEGALQPEWYRELAGNQH